MLLPSSYPGPLPCGLVVPSTHVQVRPRPTNLGLVIWLAFANGGQCLCAR